MHITRGLPQLRKLREIMDHIYALFYLALPDADGPGQAEEVAAVGQPIHMDSGETLKKVFSPHLEKALTSSRRHIVARDLHAVERGNRRHRKMQKSVYRVRSKLCLEGRIALDMLRESRAEGRDQTTRALRQARRGYTWHTVIFTTVSEIQVDKW